MFLLLSKVLLKLNSKCDNQFNYVCNYWSYYKEAYKLDAKMQVKK